MGLAEDVNFEETENHLNRQINRFLKMNNDEIEDNERYIQNVNNMDQAEFSKYTGDILSAETVDENDIEILVILLVKKYRKISGDQIVELIQQQKELSKKKNKLEKQFQKKNANLKKNDRDKIAKQ